MCLLWKADLRLRPSWQMSTIQDPRKMWLATGSLLTVWWRMPSLGLRLPLAFQFWLSPTCLSASSMGRGLCEAGQLSFGIHSVLFSVSRPGCVLEPYAGKFNFFFFFLVIPQFGLLSHVSSLRLSSGHSGLVLTLSMQTVPPCPAPTHLWQT